MEDFSISKANLTTNLQPIANNHEPKSVIRKSFLSFFNDRFGFKAERKRKYHRESRMSKAEIMVIMILFHSSGYRCLKHFYLEKVCKHMRHLFPEVVSYNRWSSESRSQTCLDYAESRQRKTIVNRFVELEREIAIPLIVFIKKVLLGKGTLASVFAKGSLWMAYNL